MRIRALIRSDIPAVRKIVGAAFSQDELFVWLYPKQDQYPLDLPRYQLIRLRTRLVDQGSRGFVAETEPSDDFYDETLGSTVVGFAFYEREGKDEAGKKWREDPLMNKLERQLLKVDMWYEDTFLQRAQDRKAIALFDTASSYKFYDTLQDYWHLGLLATDPAYQRKGIGKMLVQHGTELATREDLPVTLEASVLGRALYAKLGFKTIERSKIEGLAEEGVVMLWEPEKSKGKWLEEMEDGSFQLKIK